MHTDIKKEATVCGMCMVLSLWMCNTGKDYQISQMHTMISTCVQPEFLQFWIFK